MSHYIKEGAEIIAKEKQRNATMIDCWKYLDILQFENKRPFGSLKIRIIEKLMFEYITEFSESPVEFIKESGIIEQKRGYNLKALYHYSKLLILEKKYNRKKKIIFPYSIEDGK